MYKLKKKIFSIISVLLMIFTCFTPISTKAANNNQVRTDTIRDIPINSKCQMDLMHGDKASGSRWMENRSSV